MAKNAITKRALSESLKKLMLKMPFEKITVSDITDECGISRKCFYYHFKDKYDLVNWIFENDFMSSVDTKNFNDIWDITDKICMFFYNNRDFYKSAFAITGQNSFNDYFVEFFNTKVLNLMHDLFGEVKYDRYYALFFTDACRMAIIRWLTEFPELTPKNVTNIMKEMITSTINNIKTQDINLI